MKFIMVLLGATALLCASPSRAQQTVKIGMVEAYTGTMAIFSLSAEEGLRLYMQKKGDTVAGKKIQFVKGDASRLDAFAVSRLSRLLVQNGADILMGYDFLRNAFAAAAVSADEKKFMVSMDRQASMITTRSPYVVRSAFTSWQINRSFGGWAFRSGVRKLYTLVVDSDRGTQAESAFQDGFTSAGGRIVGIDRYPPSTSDFTHFLQRAKETNPDGIFIWAGDDEPLFAFFDIIVRQPTDLARNADIIKAVASSGIDATKIKIMSHAMLTNDYVIKTAGDNALGVITAFNYNCYSDSQNKKIFAEAFSAAFGHSPDADAVARYDGMHLIYEALKRTNGNTDAAALTDAVRGLKWESPCGQLMIDPETRDVAQTVHIRRVQKVNGALTNVEFDKVESN